VFPFDPSLDTGITLVWLVGLVAIAFLVTWLSTDAGKLRRAPFVGLLGIVTGGMTAGYLLWAGAGSGFWTYHWGWGLLAAVVVSAAMVALVRRRLPRREGIRVTGRSFAWEGLVYGTAEGMLLSVLPVAMAWQLARSLGWVAATGVMAAVLMSVAVVAIHHLGYPEFRSRIMRYPVMMCTALAIAYIASSSPLAPIIGHIVLHWAMLAQGIELPPHTSREGLERQLIRAA